MSLIFLTITLLLLPSAQCWMSEKCFVYDQKELDVQKYYCPVSKYSKPNLTASCSGITNVKLDLATIPTQIRILCLNTKPGLALLPNAFSRFTILQQLYIQGCLGIVHPRAFMGLPHLWLISFQSKDCCNSSVSSKAFGLLNTLRELYLNHYNVSVMAADVFSGLSGLKVLQILDCVSEFSDILCRIAKLSSSLISLNIDVKEMVTLQSHGCSYLDDALPDVCKSLEKVRLSFPNLQYMEKNILICFPKVWSLEMPLNNVLKTQLLQSGIRQVSILNAVMKQFDMGLICEIAYGLSIENVHLQLQKSFEMQSESVLNECVGIENLSIKSSKHIELDFIRLMENLEFFELVGNFLQHSLDSLCETDFVTSLQTFSISDSGYSKIKNRQFFCLKNLTTLSLTSNGITEIEDFAFDGLENLQVIYLNENSLLSLTSKQIFMNLHNLQKLNLAINKISVLNFEVFMNLWNLKFLNLHNNRITQITASHLITSRSLVNLEVLNLETNVISHIDDFALSHLKNLKVLKMNHNKISVITMFTFYGLDSLESLTLDFNVPKYIEPSSFSSSTGLQEFILGCLQDQSFETSGIQINLTLIFGVIPVNLTQIKISSCSRPMTLIIGSDTVPRSGVSLEVYGKEVRIQDCDRPFLRSVVSLIVMAQQLLCGDHFAGRYFKSLENLSFRAPVMSSFVDLVDLNTLVHLKNLEFASTDLSNQPHLGTMFHNLTRLESLMFSSLRIYSFNEDLSRDLRSLKILYIQDCHDFIVMENFPIPLVSLRYLIIHSVVLRCSCDTAWFNEWAKGERQVQVLMPFAFSDLTCKNVDNIQSLTDYTQANCFIDIEFLLFVCTSLCLLFFMLLVLVHNLAGDYLMAFTYIARGWVEEAMRGNARRRYQYDAFVSYCGKDERWVVEELLPNMNRLGPPFLQLCLHSRDFQLGRDIVENITDSLYKSRYTLCLMSRNYLHSKWCSLEMKLAMYRLLAEHRDVLILVFLEKIPARQLSAHHRLARIVKTRTYLDWPDDPQQQAVFWDRLWAKLAPEEFIRRQSEQA